MIERIKEKLCSVFKKDSLLLDSIRLREIYFEVTGNALVCLSISVPCRNSEKTQSLEFKWVKDGEKVDETIMNRMIYRLKLDPSTVLLEIE